MKTYDVTVIGAGPGGYVAAIRAAQRGASVALIEREHLGGTCLNWGCIPTKTLIGCADVFSQIKHAATFGVSIDGNVAADWDAMMGRKNKVVSTLRQGIGTLTKSNDVDVIQGEASFKNRKHIIIKAADGTRTEIETGSVIIATGGDAAVPGFIPESDLVFTSREILDIEALPESIVILGGGVIGCEFACLFARLGVTVTIVELLPGILPGQDDDVVRTATNELKKLGIKVLTKSKMTDIKADEGEIVATVGDKQITAECMLVCVGRRAVTSGLNLAAAGVRTDDYGCIPVNTKCRTNVAGIYAIGDVTGGIQLAHRASAMGICAANAATGADVSYTDTLVPGCIFTSPEIGAVGLTEQAAKEQGIDVKVGKFPFAALGKAMALGETSGFCKIVTDAETDQVLGVHMVGPHATDLIAEAATAMKLEVTAEELASTIHAHPTLAEATMEAAHAVHDACIHLPRPRKRR